MLDPEKQRKLREMWDDRPLKIWDWTSHLGSTLFASEGTKHWTDLQRKLMSRTGHFLAWGSQKPNQRVFVCQCGECDAVVTGKYGAWDTEEDAKNARDTLSKFVIGKPAESCKKTWRQLFKATMNAVNDEENDEEIVTC